MNRDEFLSPLRENRLGGFRTTDPDTSHKAAVLNFPRSGSQRHRIFLVAAAAGEEGITCSELYPALGLSHQSASTRCSELVRGGWLAPSGEERRSPLGGLQTVYVATPEGLEAAESL